MYNHIYILIFQLYIYIYILMYVRMRHPPSHKTFRMLSQINVTFRPAAHGPKNKFLWRLESSLLRSWTCFLASWSVHNSTVISVTIYKASCKGIIPLKYGQTYRTNVPPLLDPEIPIEESSNQPLP